MVSLLLAMIMEYAIESISFASYRGKKAQVVQIFPAAWSIRL